MTFSKVLSAAVLTCLSFAATAGPATDTLGACLADNTTGKDRKDLAKWVFVSISVHPEMKGLTTATDADREQSDKTVAALLTRLITDSCLQQARAAQQQGEQGSAPA